MGQGARLYNAAYKLSIVIRAYNHVKYEKQIHLILFVYHHRQYGENKFPVLTEVMRLNRIKRGIQ